MREVPVIGSVALAASLLLVGGCGVAGGSSWSPETADLVFSSNRDGNTEIHLLAAESSDWVNLTRNPAGDNWPEWSPNGRRIAFQSNRQGNLDIWVMEADGSNPVQLTTNPEPDYLPAWSPDGREITFASWRSEPGDSVRAVHIYVMNADGSGQRRLFAESPGTSTAAKWARGGRRFLLSRKTDQTGADIFIVDQVGQIVRRGG